jgi:hypothetical protein
LLVPKMLNWVESVEFPGHIILFLRWCLEIIVYWLYPSLNHWWNNLLLYVNI